MINNSVPRTDLSSTRHHHQHCPKKALLGSWTRPGFLAFNSERVHRDLAPARLQFFLAALRSRCISRSATFISTVLLGPQYQIPSSHRIVHITLPLASLWSQHKEARLIPPKPPVGLIQVSPGEIIIADDVGAGGEGTRQPRGFRSSVHD